jgi:murein DD-endopeptidase MepM/ murein hydrolase activator NlpD
MRRHVAFSRAALLTRVSAACLLAAAVGACSTDTARLDSNPFSNPFSSGSQRQADPVSTGSIGSQSTGTGLLSSPVRSAPLAPIASAPVAAIPNANVSPTLPSARNALTTGSLASKPAAVTGAASGWSPTGGSSVVLAHGETIETLSGRYGVPASAIRSANGLSGAGNPTPGTKIIIPVFNAAAAQASPRQVAQTSSFSSDSARAAPAAPVTSAVEGAKAKAREAAEAKVRAEQQARIDAAEARATAAEARAKALAQAPAAKAVSTKASSGKVESSKAVAETKLKADAAAKAGAKAASAKSAVDTAASTEIKAAKAAADAKAEGKARIAAEAKLKAEQKLAADAAKKQKTVVASAPEPVIEPKTTSSIAKDEPAAKPAPTADFRWPARGRVINGFSGKGGNEGINIAVPEGTPVKAADGGVVAYSGNELKGYGNLVLIRHDNGYVSAYAHNGDVAVKRGEKVARGQVIAKSGQSGNVSSPQLHFELRKGSTPVDPMPYLEN